MAADEELEAMEDGVWAIVDVLREDEDPTLDDAVEEDDDVLDELEDTAFFP